MIHFGLLHTFRKYQDIMKMMDRLKEERKAHEGGSQDTLSKFDHELKILRNFRIAYELALCDQTLAKLAEKFYAVHMSCMKIWGNFEEKQVKFGGGGANGSHPNLFCYIPENFLTDFIECFSDIMRANPRGYKAFMAETAVQIYEFCLAIIRTDQKSITNKYTKAKALELMTLFVYSDTKKELANDMNKSEIINRYLMETVVQFYVDIEFAGEGMFFTKFQYRHDCTKIF